MKDENRPEFIALCDELTAKRKTLIKTIKPLIQIRIEISTKIKKRLQKDTQGDVSIERIEIASVNGQISGFIRSHRADIIDLLTDYILDKHNIPRDILSRFSITRLQEIVFGKSLAKGRLQKKFGGGDTKLQREETDAFRYAIQPAKKRAEQRETYKNVEPIIRPPSRLMTTQSTWPRMAEMFYRTNKLYGHHEPINVLDLELSGKKFIGSGDKILGRRKSKIERKHALINNNEISKLKAMAKAESRRQ